MSFTSFMIQFPNGETKLKKIGTASQANRKQTSKKPRFHFYYNTAWDCDLVEERETNRLPQTCYRKRSVCQPTVDNLLTYHQVSARSLIFTRKSNSETHLAYVFYSDLIYGF